MPGADPARYAPAMAGTSIDETGAATPTEPTEPTWGWKLDFGMLREAAEIRKRDPREFRGAVLTFFGFGGRDDGTQISRSPRAR